MRYDQQSLNCHRASKIETVTSFREQISGFLLDEPKSSIPLPNENAGFFLVKVEVQVPCWTSWSHLIWWAYQQHFLVRKGVLFLCNSKGHSQGEYLQGLDPSTPMTYCFSTNPTSEENLAPKLKVSAIHDALSLVYITNKKNSKLN